MDHHRQTVRIRTECEPDPTACSTSEGGRQLGVGNSDGADLASHVRGPALCVEGGDEERHPGLVVLPLPRCQYQVGHGHPDDHRQGQGAVTKIVGFSGLELGLEGVGGRGGVERRQGSLLQSLPVVEGADRSPVAHFPPWVGLGIPQPHLDAGPAFELRAIETEGVVMIQVGEGTGEQSIEIRRAEIGSSPGALRQKLMPCPPTCVRQAGQAGGRASVGEGDVPPRGAGRGARVEPVEGDPTAVRVADDLEKVVAGVVEAGVELGDLEAGDLWHGCELPIEAFEEGLGGA